MRELSAGQCRGPPDFPILRNRGGQGHGFLYRGRSGDHRGSVDRLIPADDRSAGGREAGCAIFIDRQLAGPYGQAAGLYMKPPFMPGTATQGNQSPDAPAVVYRTALKQLIGYVRTKFAGQSFAALPPQDQDAVLSEIEKGSIEFKGVKGARNFSSCSCRTPKRAISPIRSTAATATWSGWKLIGFPGRGTTTATG